MSRASFPRSEHLSLLRDKIEQWIAEHGLNIEIAERGLNHYKCQYRFEFRRPSHEWMELPIHFQVAQRLEAGCGEDELNRLLETFLQRSFAGGKKRLREFGND